MRKKPTSFREGDIVSLSDSPGERFLFVNYCLPDLDGEVKEATIQPEKFARMHVGYRMAELVKLKIIQNGKDNEN